MEAVARSTSGQNDWSCARARSMVRTAIETECPALNKRRGRDRNGDLRRLTCAQSGEPFSSDTDNRERMPLDANLFPDNFGRAAKATLPELVTNNSHLRCCAVARIYVLRRQQSSEKGSYTEFGVIVTRD